MNDKIKELLELIEANPNLPVVPMVDGEIPEDDCGYWLGAWGRAYVDEYLVAKRTDRIVFRSDDDVFDTLYHYLSRDKYKYIYGYRWENIVEVVNYSKTQIFRLHGSALKKIDHFLKDGTKWHLMGVRKSVIVILGNNINQTRPSIMPERVLHWLFPVLVDVVGDKLIDHRIHGGSVLFDSGAELFVFIRVYPNLQALLFVKVFSLGAVFFFTHFSDAS